MKVLVVLNVILVSSMTIIQAGEYGGLSVVYSQYNGLVYTYNSDGRKTHPSQNLKMGHQISPSHKKQHNKFIPKIDPSKCQGDTFCEEADYYPYQEVDKQLAQAGEAEYKYIFGVDDIELATKMDNPMERVDLGETRKGYTIHAICETTMKIIFPRIARNKNNQWKYVVNQGVEKVQGIAIEWCKDLGAECTYMISRNSYLIPTCGQKYSYRRLLSLSHEGELESDIFEFPVACMCYLKSYLFKR